MNCNRCGSPMREMKRSHHKKRKWVCPKCGRARMQRPKSKPDRRPESRERDD